MGLNKGQPMSKKRTRKTNGYADTKHYPHKNHPARYRKTNKDTVEYVTLTHHKFVVMNDKVYETIPLNDNIDKRIQKTNKNKKDKEISYVYPKVFVGKRSALGKENKNYELILKDNNLVNDLFKSLPKENISYTTNSKKK